MYPLLLRYHNSFTITIYKTSPLLLGLMSGRVLIHFKTHKERLTRWFIWATTFLLMAGILCGFKKDGGFIPLNKNLWSTSFVSVNAGIGLIGTSICYILIDVYKVWSGAPFIWLGMNSILSKCTCILSLSCFHHYSNPYHQFIAVKIYFMATSLLHTCYPI